MNRSTILIFVFVIVPTVCYFFIRFIIKHSKPNSDIRRSYKSHQNKIPIWVDLTTQHTHTHTHIHTRTHTHKRYRQKVIDMLEIRSCPLTS